MPNFRTFDLNLLRVFDALMQARNVTRAAEALGLSQPAVSSALARMRHQLGDPLFVRVGNGMTPTPHAEALFPSIQRALDEVQVAFSDLEPFDPLRAETVFTLLGADFFSTRLMPDVAARLSREAPGTSVRFLDSGRGGLVELLEAQVIDAALEQPTEVPPWVSTALLFPSPFKIVASRNNALIREAGKTTGDTLPLELYCALPHAMRSVDGSMSGQADAALARVGRRRRVAVALPHFDAILTCVAKSDMIATVPVQLVSDSAEDFGLVVLEPPFEIPVPMIRMYWHGRLDRTPAQVWFRNLIRDEVARLWGQGERSD